MTDTSRRVVDPVTQEEILVPPSRSADQAIARAAKLRNGELTVIRMLPEHLVRWPLWIAEYGPVEPDAVGVSLGLADRLAEWSATWERNAMSGWPSAEEAAEWQADGDALAELLEEELWESADVRRDFRA